MGAYGLPALHVNPPQQGPGPLEQYGQLAQLRAMMGQQQLQQQQIQGAQLENQVRQRQVQDQNAMTQAMQEWDGKDINQLPGLVLKNHGSANAVLGLKSSLLDYSTKLNGLTTSELANEKQVNDMIAGHIDSIKQLPAEQQPQAFEAAKQDLAQKLPPQYQQQIAGIQYQGPQQLDVLEKMFMGHSAQVDQALKQAQTGEAQAKSAQSQAEAAKAQAETAQGGNFSDTSRFISNYLKTNNLPDTPANRLAAQRQYIKETKIVPAQMRVEGFGAIRQMPVYDSKTGQTVYLDSNTLNQMRSQEPGRYTVPSYTPEAIGQKSTTQYFTSGKGAQQLTAFNTAMQHLDLLDKLGADLNNTNLQVANRAKQAWAEQTGNPAPANFEAAKNAMSGEVAAALKASGATDQEIAKVEETFSRKQSPEQLKGAIDTYRQLLQSKAHNLGMQYQQGMQGKPNLPQSNHGNNQNSDPFAQFGGKARQ